MAYSNSVSTLHMISIKFSLLVALVGLTLCEGEFCQTDETSVNSFSTRTLYDTVRGTETIRISGKGCAPASMWVLARDGVSFPTENEIQRFSELSKLKDAIINNHLKLGSGDVCPEGLDKLRSWNLNMEIEMADRLINSETKTIPEIAKRILSKFRKFNEQMHVKYTSTLKTKESADAFIAAMGSNPINEDLVDDKLLLKEEPLKETNETLAFSERKLAQVYRNVAVRLGFTNLKPSIVEDMYKLCSYDRLLNEENSSPWCSLFTEEELKVMEYKEDLLSYHTSGYGNPAGKVKGCTLLFDLMHRLSNYRTLGRSTIYFANDEALRNLLVSMGLQQDNEPLSADNYSSSSEMSWKNSALTPFNGNLMAILHRCNGGLEEPDNYFVTLYHNENPVQLPWCGGAVCDIITFTNYYTKSIDDDSCDLSSYYQEDDTPTVTIENNRRLRSH